MKKLRFLFLAVLVFGLIFTGCGNGTTTGGGDIIVESTNGQLTITGLEAYNGQWIFAATNDLVAAAGLDANSVEMKLAKISDGKAVLKVWKVGEFVLDDYDELISAAFKNYNGNDHKSFYATVCTFETLPIDFSVSSEDPPLGEDGEVDVTFTNGKGSGVFIPD